MNDEETKDRREKSRKLPWQFAVVPRLRPLLEARLDALSLSLSLCIPQLVAQNEADTRDEGNSSFSA